MSEDEQMQKKGGLLIFWANAETIDALGDQKDRREAERIFMAVPIRMVACHICIPPDPMFRCLSSLLLLILGKEGRKVSRVHSGEFRVVLQAK
jgi:hypothetical protein